MHADTNEGGRDLRAELAALAAMSDDEIDTSDVPEVTDWSRARRGIAFGDGGGTF